MRSHQQIISDAGAKAVAELIEPHVGPGELEKLRKRVVAWEREGSIPGEYWQLLAAAKVATVDELSASATHRKFGWSADEAAA